jgi:hypothetical protein
VDDFIRFSCPACGKRRKAPPRHAGRKARCSCGQALIVPSTLHDADASSPSAVRSGTAGLGGMRSPYFAFEAGSGEQAADQNALPDFCYQHLPFGRIGRRRVTFGVHRAGRLTSVSKTVRTFVTGGGGGGSIHTDTQGRVQGSVAPVWIDTTHETTMDLWIFDDQGRESSVRVKTDIPLREGHEVTVVAAHLEGGSERRLCLILDHTARARFFLQSSHELVGPTPAEWGMVSLFIFGISIVLMSLVLLLTRLLGLAAGCFGAFASFAFVGIWLLLLMRKSSLRRQFLAHCEAISGSLL